MKLYQSDDYRHALKECLLEKKISHGNTYSFQNMANACRVQKTYLSKVLGEKAHLNSDQLYLAAEYLGFNDQDRLFLTLLFEECRSVVPKRKKNLKGHITLMRRHLLRSEQHIDSKVVSPQQEHLASYYLNPLMQVVHMFLTIERYAQNVNEIGQKLHLSKDVLTNILRSLQYMGIIEIHEGRYKVVLNNLHSPKDSELYPAYRVLLRTLAQDRMSRLTSDNTYNFSVIFSTDSQTQDQIQADFLKFLQKTQQLVSGSKSENVYQINFDLFSWDR